MVLFETSPEDKAIHNLYLLDNMTDEWLLVSSPYPVTCILALYLLFVLKLGPALMKSRPPVQLDTAMRFYNLLQVLINGFMVVRFLVEPDSVGKIWKHTCSVESLPSFKRDFEHLLFYSWILLVSKITDLLDTVFMVLRKKNSHITFLHVYHHTAMVFFVWLSFQHRSHILLVPGLINLIVHTIMYSYYFMATFPQLKPKLWWKQHLTKLQLGQFVVVIAYLLIMVYKKCYMPRIYTYIWIPNVTVICLFFLNFYRKAYIVERNTNEKKIT